jgi:diguanylate cyclase (GGDEF)-like protein
MLQWPPGPTSDAHPPSDELLHEQYLTLRRQIPLMYALMFINVSFLAFETFRDVPLGLSFGVPGALSIAIIIRAALWVHRRSVIATPAEVRLYLRGTIVTAAILSAIFGGWGLILFNEADPIRSISIALYIFVGGISCCFCLQALPIAGRFVLIFGVMPVTIRLLMTPDWALFSVGANFLVVTLLILRTLSTSYDGFVQVLQSRAGMLAEQERARSAEQLAQELSYRDPLTGLENRRALGEQLEALNRAPEAQAPLALLMLDLDLFKSVNDVHGHAAGDRLLQAVALRLGETIGPSATAYRLGGDEFAVILQIPERGRDAALGVADRLVREMAFPFSIEGLSHFIGASVGISLFPDDASDAQSLMRRADIAMYDAKARGRSRRSCFEGRMDAELTARSILEREMRVDLEGDAFHPVYQPIVSLASGRIVGFEMLARWKRGDGKFVGPTEFIPVAEECGLIGRMMLKLLERVCSDASDWPAELTISINVSPVQLRDPWLSEKILGVLTRKRFPSQRISLEITENALIADPGRAQLTIESLKNQGMLLSLDDFGTGYSSIQHLRMLPFDKLKIDRSFVLNVDTDPEAYRMVSGIVQLAASLQLTVIAEGVERNTVLETLRSMGCQEAQGFLFGAPMSAREASEVLRGVSWPALPNSALLR